LTDHCETKTCYEIGRLLQSECYTTGIIWRTGGRCC